MTVESENFSDNVNSKLSDALPLFNNFIQAVIVADPNGVIIYSNPSWKNVYSNQDDEKKTIYDLLYDKTSDVRPEEFFSAFKSMEKWSGELILNGRDHKLIPTLLCKSPFGNGFNTFMLHDLSELRKNHEMMYFLNRASEELNSSLVYKTTLKNITSLIVPRLADWFVIEVKNDSGSVDLLTVAHRDPEKVKWALELRKTQPVDMSAQQGLPNVLRTGKPELYPDIPDEMLVAVAKDEEQLKLIRSIGYRSVMIVPMTVRGNTFGAITFIATSESKRNYNEQDLIYAEDFARRTALALENVNLYEDLKQKQDRMDTLFNTVPGLVWEIIGTDDESLKSIFVSDYVEQLLGYSKEEYISSKINWTDLIHEEDKEHAIQESKKLFENKSQGVIQYRMRRKDGQVIWVETRIRTILNVEAEVIGSRGVTMDISEIKKLEQRKDEFIGMASHELKTPVTSLKIFAQTLVRQFENSPDERTKTVLNRMNAQIDRMSNLITDLLDLSRIQTGKFSYSDEKFSFNELIKEVVDTMQTASPDYKISVQENDQLVLNADRDRLGQVLINILSNAVKYSPDHKEVEVVIKKEASDALVSIRDYGVGIEMQHKNKIFERFYRIYEANEKTFPGLGIGLNISHIIINHYNGKIWFESEKGKGTIFYISIPLHN